jgi:hypothetical protein
MKCLEVSQLQHVRCRLTLDEISWRLLTWQVGMPRTDDSWVAYRVGYWRGFHPPVFPLFIKHVSFPSLPLFAHNPKLNPSHPLYRFVRRASLVTSWNKAHQSHATIFVLVFSANVWYVAVFAANYETYFWVIMDGAYGERESGWNAISLQSSETIITEKLPCHYAVTKAALRRSLCCFAFRQSRWNWRYTEEKRVAWLLANIAYSRIENWKCKHAPVFDFRLPPRYWDLRSSGVLRSVDW